MDCTSAFVGQDVQVQPLCIPTAFCSYTGEALDQKTPSFLRSMEAINKEVLSSDPTVWQILLPKKVTPSVAGTGVFPGRCCKIWRRERSDLYRKNLVRRDARKGQELDDH